MARVLTDQRSLSTTLQQGQTDFGRTRQEADTHVGRDRTFLRGQTVGLMCARPA